MKMPMLISPGSIMVEDCVQDTLQHYDICCRELEFKNMFRHIENIKAT